MNSEYVEKNVQTDFRINSKISEKRKSSRIANNPKLAAKKAGVTTPPEKFDGMSANSWIFFNSKAPESTKKESFAESKNTAEIK